MRLLIALIVVAALGWSAYWFIGARALESALVSGIAEAREAGVELDTASLDVTGFPNRFDTVIDQPRLHFPASGITWSAPFLQVFALSYRPNRVIAVLPETQSLTGPFGDAQIDAGDARASATFAPTPALPLDHANFVAEDVAITSAGAELSLARLLAASRLPEGNDAGDMHNIGVTLENLDLPPAMAERLGGGAAGRIESAAFDGLVTFSQPLDRAALTGGTVEVRRVEINELTMDWAGLGLDATGALDVGRDGSLTGNLDASLANWPRAVEIAVATGLIAPDRAGSVRQGLSLLAGLSGGGDAISAPLEFRDGGIFLGPVRLGDAPRF